MALIICPECGKEISDKALQCIHCGCPIITSEIPNENSNSEEVISTTPSVNDEKRDISLSIENKDIKNKIIKCGGVVVCVGVLFAGGIFLYHHSDGYYSKIVDGYLAENNLTDAKEYADKISDEDKKNTYLNTISTKQREEQIRQVKSSADTYFQSGNFDKASELYESINDDSGVAKCLQYSLAAIDAKLLKSSLKNPSSLQINEVRVNPSTKNCYYFDYSGQNGFGGVSRTSIIFQGYSIYQEKESSYSSEKIYYFDDREDYTVLDADLIVKGIEYVGD